MGTLLEMIEIGLSWMAPDHTALLVLTGLQVARLLLCLVFVAVVGALRGRGTGRYPTLREATDAVRALLVASPRGPRRGRGRGTDPVEGPGLPE